MAKTELQYDILEFMFMFVELSLIPLELKLTLGAKIILYHFFEIVFFRNGLGSSNDFSGSLRDKVYRQWFPGSIAMKSLDPTASTWI